MQIQVIKPTVKVVSKLRKPGDNAGDTWDEATYTWDEATFTWGDTGNQGSQPPLVKISTEAPNILKVEIQNP